VDLAVKDKVLTQSEGDAIKSRVAYFKNTHDGDVNNQVVSLPSDSQLPGSVISTNDSVKEGCEETPLMSVPTIQANGKDVETYGDKNGTDGGTVIIAAARDINNKGLIEANGGHGADAPVPEGSTGENGGDGALGGTISLSAMRSITTSEGSIIRANGGNGGNGGSVSINGTPVTVVDREASCMEIGSIKFNADPDKTSLNKLPSGSSGSFTIPGEDIYTANGTLDIPDIIVTGKNNGNGTMTFTFSYGNGQVIQSFTLPKNAHQTQTPLTFNAIFKMNGQPEQTVSVTRNYNLTVSNAGRRDETITANFVLLPKGQAGNITIAELAHLETIASATGGDGGHGQDGGLITFSYGKSMTHQGLIEANGGHGGDGGSATVSSTAFAPDHQKAVAEAYATGGHGGHGDSAGTIVFSGPRNPQGHGIVKANSGSGGNGGNATASAIAKTSGVDADWADEDARAEAYATAGHNGMGAAAGNEGHIFIPDPKHPGLITYVLN
jgi:hypothetical protein